MKEEWAEIFTLIEESRLPDEVKKQLKGYLKVMKKRSPVATQKRIIEVAKEEIAKIQNEIN